MLKILFNLTSEYSVLKQWFQTDFQELRICLTKQLKLKLKENKEPYNQKNTQYPKSITSSLKEINLDRTTKTYKNWQRTRGYLARAQKGNFLSHSIRIPNYLQSIEQKTRMVKVISPTADDLSRESFVSILFTLAKERYD